MARLGLAGKAEARAFRAESLAKEGAAGDVVVSMLPASEHPMLVQLALAHRAHFVCSSYVSPGIRAYADAARERGSVALPGVGREPGIDHLLAHELARKAQAVTGAPPAPGRFPSYCRN